MPLSLEEFVSKISVKNYQMTEDDIHVLDSFRDATGYYNLDLLYILSGNDAALSNIWDNLDIFSEKHPNLLNAISHVKDGLSDINKFFGLVVNSETKQYLTMDSLVRLAKLYVDIPGFNIFNYIYEYPRETHRQIYEIFAAAGEINARIAIMPLPAPPRIQKADLPSPPPMPTTPLPKMALPPPPKKPLSQPSSQTLTGKVNQEFAALKKKAEDLINALQKIPKDKIKIEYLMLLQNIQIQAMAKGAKEVDESIRKFLRENSEFNEIYQDLIIRYRRPAAFDVALSPVKELPIRYLHGRIEMEHIHPKNGKVLREKEIELVREAIKNKNILEEADGFGYRILKMKDQAGKDVICAIYGDKLGGGSFGQVFLAQNLETGEWVAVKIQLIDKSKPVAEQERQVKMINEEMSAQQVAGQYIGQMDIKNAENNSDIPDQIIMAVKLAEGIELYNQIKDRNSLLQRVPANIWLAMGSQLLNVYHEQVWDAGYLHRDLKPENIMINPATGEMTIIDKGFATRKVGNEVKGEHAMGSPMYMAPELAFTDQHGQSTYTEKSEVFALGMILLYSYGFSVTYNFNNDKHRTNGPEHFNNLDHLDLHLPMSRFPGIIAGETTIRDAMHNFLKRMVDKDPNKRPSLEECQRFFKVFEGLCLNVTNKIKDVFIFDINEYRQANGAEKSAIIAMLRAANEVWLIDSTKQKDEFEYMAIVSELQKNGVLVGKRLFTQPDDMTISKENLIIGVKNRVDNLPDYQDKIINYTYVTSHEAKGEFRKQLEAGGIAHAYVGSKAMLDLQEYKNCDDVQKQLLITDLKKVGQVWLIDSAENPNNDSNLMLQHELRSHGVTVGEKIFDINSTPIKSNKLSDLVGQVRQEEMTPNSKFYYVTQHELNDIDRKTLENLGMNCSRSIPQVLNHDQWRKIADGLEKEIERLIEKYKGKNPVVNERVSAIHKVEREFAEAFKNNMLTLPVVQVKLDSLQNQMYSAGVVSSLLLKWTSQSITYTDSEKAIEKIKKELPQPVEQRVRTGKTR